MSSTWVAKPLKPFDAVSALVDTESKILSTSFDNWLYADTLWFNALFIPSVVPLKASFKSVTSVLEVFKVLTLSFVLSPDVFNNVDVLSNISSKEPVRSAKA